MKLAMNVLQHLPWWGTFVILSFTSSVCSQDCPIQTTSQELTQVENLQRAPIVLFGQDLSPDAECKISPCKRRQIHFRVTCVIQTDMLPIRPNITIGFELGDNRSCAHTVFTGDRINDTILVMLVRVPSQPDLYDWYETNPSNPAYMLLSPDKLQSVDDAFSLNGWSPTGTKTCPGFAATPECPKDWTRVLDRCVWESQERATYPEAKTDCEQRLGASLVTIEDVDYREALLQTLGSSHVWSAGQCVNTSCHWKIPNAQYPFTINHQQTQDNRTGPVLVANTWYIVPEKDEKHLYACQKSLGAEFGIVFRSPARSLGSFCCRRHDLPGSEINMYKALKADEEPSFKFGLQPTFNIFPEGNKGGVYTVIVTATEWLWDLNGDPTSGYMLHWVVVNALADVGSEGITALEYLFPLPNGTDVVNGRGDVFIFRLLQQQRRLVPSEISEYLEKMKGLNSRSGCPVKKRCVKSLEDFTNTLDLIQIDRKHIRASRDGLSVYNLLYKRGVSDLTACRTVYPDVKDFNNKHVICPPPASTSGSNAKYSYLSLVFSILLIIYLRKFHI